MTKDYATLADVIATFKGYTAPHGLSKAVDRLILNDASRERIAQAAETPSIAYLNIGELERGPAATSAPMAVEQQHSPRESDGELAQMSARQIAQEVQSGQLSPSDVARYFYARAAASPELKAFISLDEDLLMRDARAIEAMLASGGERLPFAGVPVAVADVIAVYGYPTTNGTKVVTTAPAIADAALVQRLRRAGALLFGKTNVDELGYAATGLHCPYGRVRNPAAPSRITGGSSCGSAAAVAASLSPVALGTDTGGALRVPASCCGIVGLKPTIGAIDLAGYSMRWPTLDVVGPMARSVADTVLAWEVMADRPPGSLLGATDRIGAFTFLKPANFFGSSWVSGGWVVDHATRALTSVASSCLPLLRAL
jgi:Amidase